MSRLPALADAELAAPVADLFDQIVRGGGAVPPVYRVLAHSPRAVAAWHGLSAPLREPGALPLDLKELVVLRVAHLTGSTRQWAHHRELAVAAGIDQRKIDAVRAGDDPGVFTATEQAALRVADRLDEETLLAVLDDLGAEQTVELVLVVSYYRCLAGVLAAFGLT